MLRLQTCALLRASVALPTSPTESERLTVSPDLTDLKTVVGMGERSSAASQGIRAERPPMTKCRARSRTSTPLRWHTHRPAQRPRSAVQGGAAAHTRAIDPAGDQEECRARMSLRDPRLRDPGLEGAS